MGSETHLSDSVIDILQLPADAARQARERAEDEGIDPVDALLVEQLVDEADLLEALGEATGANAADPSDYDQIEREAFEALSLDDIRRLRVIPFRKHRHSLALFVVDPLDEDEVAALADEYSVSISQFVWPRLRFVEACHNLLGDGAEAWLEEFIDATERRVAFGDDAAVDEATETEAPEGGVDLDALGVGWSHQQTIDFIEHCYDRDGLLYALLGFAGRWFDNRMILVLGYERAQPYLVEGWPELSEDYRDLSTLRRVKVDIPADAVVFDREHIGHSVAEMPEEVGLGQLFVELTIFPPDKLVVQTVLIGNRPSMAVLGEPRSDDLPAFDALEDAAQAVGAQLEEIVRLAKAKQLPPSDERIPPVPQPTVDFGRPAMPGLEAVSSNPEDRHAPQDDNPSATAFGIPFADEADRDKGSPADNSSATAYGIPFADEADQDDDGAKANSSARSSTPGVAENSSVSIMEPYDVDDNDDGNERDGDDQSADALEDEDVRSTMSGGFSVAEFETKLAEQGDQPSGGTLNLAQASRHLSEADESASESTGESVSEVSQADDADDADDGKSRSTAPMAQILRPISLKKGRSRSSNENSAKATGGDEASPSESGGDDADDDDPDQAPSRQTQSVEPQVRQTQAASPQSTQRFAAPRVEEPQSIPSEAIEAFSEGLSAPNSSLAEDLAEIAAQLDSADPQEAFAAAEQIAGFGEPAMGLLDERFPGRLLVDRYQYTIDTLPPVNEHGPVLAALVAAGEPAVDVARSFVEHTSVELRFYATFLFTELPVDDALDDILTRIFDRDQQTREVAKRIVLDQREEAWFADTVLPMMRDLVAAGTEDLRVEVAAELLGTVRDRESVALLIDGLEKYNGRVKDRVHQALREITYKNFVPSVSEWKNWWADATHQSRHDWLVAALNSNSDDIRKLAFGELQQFDGLELNYHPDQPPKLRGRAQSQLRDWLQQSRQ